MDAAINMKWLWL